MRRYVIALVLGMIVGAAMNVIVIVSWYRISRTVNDAIAHVVQPIGADTPRRAAAMARALLLCELDLEAETDRANAMAQASITMATVGACLKFHPRQLKRKP